MRRIQLQKPMYMLATVFMIVGFVLAIVINAESYAPFEEFIDKYNSIRYPYVPTYEAYNLYTYITKTITPFFVTSYVFYGVNILIGIILLIAHYLSDSDESYPYFVFLIISYSLTSLIMSLWEFKILHDQDPEAYNLGILDIIQIILLGVSIIFGIVSYVLKKREVDDLYVCIFGLLSGSTMLLSLVLSFASMGITGDNTPISWAAGSFYLLFSIAVTAIYGYNASQNNATYKIVKIKPATGTSNPTLSNIQTTSIKDSPIDDKKDDKITRLIKLNLMKRDGKISEEEYYKQKQAIEEEEE